MKDLEDWAAVHIVYKQTKSKRATARILGISRNTVKKLLEKKEDPEYHRTIYHSKIEPYKAVCFSLREDADAIYEAVQVFLQPLNTKKCRMLSQKLQREIPHFCMYLQRSFYAGEMSLQTYFCF